MAQAGHSLTGNVVLHNPIAGTIQIPITSGSATDGTVLFSGHAQVGLGNVAISFKGREAGSGILGAADVTVDTFLGGETEKASLLLTKG